MTVSPSPTQTLAEWVVGSQWPQISEEARAAASRSWLNWLGCAIGGANDPAMDRLVLALQPLAGNGTAPLIGRPGQTDPATAALLHAFASNILDYDDTHWATAIHPAGPVASALAAWSSQERVSGQEVMHAFLLGMEVSCRIGLAVSPGHYEKGWHISGTCGVFGAAVAVGRLMKLSPQQMTWALGHAATQSAGLVASLGTMAKSLNIAHAARSGLVAAQLARHSITANEQALETRFGFAHVLGSGSLNDSVCEGLGKHWEAARNTFKPYPCGFLLHPALDACLAAPDRLSVSSGAIDQVDRIIVSVSPLALVRADRPHPTDALASKLSTQHAVAVALLYGDAGVQRFTDAAVCDDGARALRAKTEVVADDQFTAECARVELRWRDGRSQVREICQPLDQPPLAMSNASLTRKFRELVAHGAPHCNADHLLATLDSFLFAPDAAELLTLTRPNA
ncbi:MmgE/PrpD family protein [Limnohabitans sp. 2KL-17]|uniref:MmgE/PrpD family protein n=1 Tax=Limnohabitans sp. 2KL-17 TaxID=1100704 RepID=UPI001304F6EB|nr:MmgE/PrpD family protein [Limnohabitans sp. 2KL-17]